MDRLAPSTPPDLSELPPLPPRFSWLLPAPKRRRHSMPEGRQVVVDGGGLAVAIMQPAYERATAIVGVHRPLHADQIHREFIGPGARSVALRFVARWVELRSETILTEIEARRYK